MGGYRERDRLLCRSNGNDPSAAHGENGDHRGVPIVVSPSNGDDLSAAHRKNGDNPGKNHNNHGVPVVERPVLFSGILPAEYTEICRVGRVKEFSRGAMLYFEDDAVERIFLLTSGLVKISKFGREGGEVILNLAVPGDVLGMVGLFSCGMHCTTAEVFRAGQALVWDTRVFKGLVERFPVLHQNSVAILSGYLRELEDRFREVATERVGPRVALQLLRLLKTIGRPANGAVEIGLSREELGQMTGTTLFTVSRLLSAWEARGVVRPRREAVAICDVQSLHAISQEDSQP